jgi:hypothetical protein
MTVSNFGSMVLSQTVEWIQSGRVFKDREEKLKLCLQLSTNHKAQVIRVKIQ